MVYFWNTNKIKLSFYKNVSESMSSSWSFKKIWQKHEAMDVSKTKTSFSGSNDIWDAAWQNQQSDLCAQRRLWSAWAFAQSDQSLRCPHEETLGPQLPIECTAKTLIRLGGWPGWTVFAGRTGDLVGFVMHIHMCNTDLATHAVNWEEQS